LFQNPVGGTQHPRLSLRNVEGFETTFREHNMSRACRRAGVCDWLKRSPRSLSGAIVGCALMAAIPSGAFGQCRGGGGGMGQNGGANIAGLGAPGMLGGSTAVGTGQAMAMMHAAQAMAIQREIFMRQQAAVLIAQQREFSTRAARSQEQEIASTGRTELSARRPATTSAELKARREERLARYRENSETLRAKVQARIQQQRSRWTDRLAEVRERNAARLKSQVAVADRS
jgi:hypothetical protein